MQKREIFLGIDLLRFLAAVLVMGYHLAFKAWSLEDYHLQKLLNGPAGLFPWSTASWFGWIGVQIFFVISGFVIAFSSETTTPGKFLVGRVARLAPVMWISATICLAITCYWQTFSPQLALVLYLKSLIFFPFGPWIAGQVWTLPIEIIFYATIWILIILRCFWHIDRVCLVLALASAGYWVAMETGMYVEQSGRLTQLLLLQHGCYFALGGAMWLLKRKGATVVNLLILVISIAPTWWQIETSLRWEAPGFGFETHTFVPYTVWAGSMALMAASIFWNNALTVVLSPARGFVQLLGRLTYPLYLLHLHVGGMVMVWSYHWGWSPACAIAAAFAASTAASYVIARWLEKPIAKIVTLWLQKVTNRGAIPA